MLVSRPNMQKIIDLKAQLMARTLEMKDLGVRNQILGMKIQRNKTFRKISLSQNTYIENIFQCFNMQNAKLDYTPLPAHFKLSSR